MRTSLLLAALLITGRLLATPFALDNNHTEVGFKVKHLMISTVPGKFKQFAGGFDFDPKKGQLKAVSVTIDVASIDTGVPDRDVHLKSADFFDVENHKQILFAGKSFDKVDNENYTLYGDLTIKGITNPVKLDVEFGGVMKDPWGNEKAGYVLNGKINRKDWGLTWNAALETGGLLVGDEVKINCEVELVKQA